MIIYVRIIWRPTILILHYMSPSNHQSTKKTTSATIITQYKPEILTYNQWFSFKITPKMWLLNYYCSVCSEGELLDCVCTASPERTFFGAGLREQSRTEPLNALLNISHRTDQIRTESQCRSYGSQVVTSHRIKVKGDRLWTPHRVMWMTLESHLNPSIVNGHAAAQIPQNSYCL